MKNSVCRTVTLALVVGLTLSAPVRAEDAQPAAKPKSFALSYVPPKSNSGAPAAGARLGGATRGPTATLPELLALVPDHVARSSRATPDLFWFIAAEAPLPVGFTLTDEDADEPLIELQLKAPISRGMHAIRLGEHGVELESGHTYEWFVSLVAEGDSRAADVIAGGVVTFVAPPEGLAATASGSDNPAAVYAREGYWYDALGLLSAAVADPATASAAREARASLLDQVGLKQAAAFDRGE